LPLHRRWATLRDVAPVHPSLLFRCRDRSRQQGRKLGEKSCLIVSLNERFATKPVKLFDDLRDFLAIWPALFNFRRPRYVSGAQELHDIVSGA